MKIHLGIVGGGASGLIAAAAALRLGLSVTVLEGSARTGKKLSMTGNGKGNYTNMALSVFQYPGAGKDFLTQAFSRFDHYDTLAFFEELGVYPILRNGYVYPRSEQASALSAALLREIERLGGTILTEYKVSAIRRSTAGFTVIPENGEPLSFDRLILAAGGTTAARTGSDGSGYVLARSLGHSVRPPVPALSGLLLEKGCPLEKTGGVRTEAGITLYIDNRKATAEEGELQLTDHGISGIPVMQLSGLASRALYEGKPVRIEIDFLPEWSEAEAGRLFAAHPEADGILPARLVKILPKDRGSWPALLKHYRAAVTGVRDPENAQVTNGGIPLTEVDQDTMASKRCAGLFLAGEILDVDGRCGGYNLQWAWTSGVLAACGAAGTVRVRPKPRAELLEHIRQAERADRRK